MDVKYSIDKIRLMVQIYREDFTLLSELRVLTTSEADINVITGEKTKFWMSSKMSDFIYNLSVEQNEDSSYYLGYMHNSTKDEHGRQSFFIEFNPNKVKRQGILKWVLERYFTEACIADPFSKCRISGFDVACDFAKNIMNVFVDVKAKKRYMFYTERKTMDDMTHYIGKGNMRVKVYNKALEMAVLEYKKMSKKAKEEKRKIESFARFYEKKSDFTRYEISFQQQDIRLGTLVFDENDKKFPEISIADAQICISMTPDERILLLGAIQQPTLVKSLPRRKRDKIEAFLKEMEVFRPKSNVIQEKLREFKENWILTPIT